MELGRAKIALEHLYNTGHLAICNRVNFQRVYDLRDRVLPAWVDRREPDADEAMRSLLEISSKALGMCIPAQVAHYFHAKQADARPLIARGRLVTVTARLADGADHELVVHRDNLPLLQRAADGELRPRRTTFLSPFDSLFWASGRPAILAVPPVLECYKPQPQHEWSSGRGASPTNYNGRAESPGSPWQPHRPIAPARRQRSAASATPIE